MSRPSARSHSIVAGRDLRASLGAADPPRGSRSSRLAVLRARSTWAVAIRSAPSRFVETPIDGALDEARIEHLGNVVALHRGIRPAECGLRVREHLGPTEGLC